ncbi:B3/B4 domain-containing protein [Anaeromicrobium sediminis]|uniref:B3/B4 tRNA-binding domain-containing protein n=1 Tax=Anaeromicrobium sediminis TaxID=1478221 RepID=A0A267MMA4_9FIRM|nr:B3/4 domain-containing protein [Anaeromicrobium sediminis]PAB60005.1 hypothetical protein CCE28_06420 [Anaeromicrobium sediminis]
MKKFIIEEGFWNLFPQAQIGVLVCNHIDNSIKDGFRYESLLREAEKKATHHISSGQFSENKCISIWRDAFKKFPTKKGSRASIENLLKRVSKGNEIGNINPLVDIYNSISLNYALPCGGEDMDKFVGNLRLTHADGDESFIPLGETDNKSPKEGEIVYKDDESVICRCLNWREAERTILTEKTKNAILVIESIDEVREDDLKKAVAELKNLVINNLGGSCSTYIMNKDNKEIVI